MSIETLEDLQRKQCIKCYFGGQSKKSAEKKIGQPMCTFPLPIELNDDNTCPKFMEYKP